MEARQSPAAIDGLSEQTRDVAERFSRFRTPGNTAYFEALAKHFAHLRDHPILPLHFEYAVTANDRGREAVRGLLRHVRLRRSFWRRPRVLDLGCAYGGFLIAFAEKGARVTGIEINESLLGLALINLRENMTDANLVQGDATALHPGFRGRFDLITANDVVEHVPRLEPFLDNLRDWLSPDGVAYLEIPNGDYPGFVIKDGHHELFGIAQLDFQSASQYMAHLYQGGSYDTYNYLTLSAYREVFASRGLSLTMLPETLMYASVESVAQQVSELEAGLEAGLQKVPAPVRPLVRERVSAYLSRVNAAPRESAEDREKFLLDYGVSFWKVLARRSS